MKSRTAANYSRVDYENATEQLMLPLVQREPLLPLYEAVHNAVHASQEANLENIKIEIVITRDSSVPVNDVARITNFSITDYGVGFTDSKCTAFFSLFTPDKKLRFNSRGVGRLSFFSSFHEVNIQSIYQQDELFYERNFSVTIKSIGNQELPDKCIIDDKFPKTTVTMSRLRTEFLAKYPISSSLVFEKLKEHFAPAILSSQENIELHINDSNKTAIINKSSYNSNKGKPVILKGETFNIYYIKNTQPTKGSHNIDFTAAGRVVLPKNIKFLANNKIGNKDEDKFYLRVLVTSHFLDKTVVPTRTRFFDSYDNSGLGRGISIDDIYDAVSLEVREYINEIMPDIINANNITIARVVDELPHLSVVSENTYIRTNVPLYSSEQQIRDALVQEYTKEQLKSLNYVRTKSAQYDNQGVPNFDDFIRAESDKLEHGSRINHAHLVTYVLYREYIINLFSRFLTKKEDDKYSPESVLHNLIFPMKSKSENCDADYFKHNLWLVDDRYAAYSYLTSDMYEGTISEQKCEPTDKRYDIFAVYEDPIGGAAQNVFLIELKQTHKPLSKDNDPVQQLIDYAIRIHSGKLDKEDGGRINITPSTQYYGIVLCDIHNSYFKIMELDHSLRSRSDGRSYYTLQMQDKLFIEVTNYENFLEIAKLRNKVFLDKLRFSN